MGLTHIFDKSHIKCASNFIKTRIALLITNDFIQAELTRFHAAQIDLNQANDRAQRGEQVLAQLLAILHLRCQTFGEQSKILEHGPREVNAVVHSEVPHELVADHCYLALLVQVDIELVSLHRHSRQDDRLAGVLDSFNLGGFALGLV